MDPYSFRVSLILPYWLVRFRNMHFRAFIEHLIRMHLPAHLFARICWLNQEQMDLFEKAYRPWRKALADYLAFNECGRTPPEKIVKQRTQTQNRLIEIWLNLRSVYPQATLMDCIEGDHENPVVLDNMTLGSG
ncbi:MAG: hypothetical protein QNK37_24165 [Acidobacteriota bacterium]|nr:hypothetical protein [Acidobacteriota bacterium]